MSENTERIRCKQCNGISIKFRAKGRVRWVVCRDCGTAWGTFEDALTLRERLAEQPTLFDLEPYTKSRDRYQ